MTAAGVASNADERCVETILGCVCPQKADGSLHIVNLCREFRLTTGAVVDAHYGEARIDQRLAYRVEGCMFGIVGEPCTTVNIYDDLKRPVARLGQIDVHAVSFHLIAGIVDVFECLCTGLTIEKQ